MRRATVTVVVPTYNRSAMLTEAVESVLGQTFGDLEVVVFDNASTDETAERIRAIPDSRVRYVARAAAVEQIQNVRSAIASSRTEYTAVLFDDDLYDADHLRSAIAALRDHPYASLYGCAVACFCTDGGPPSRYALPDRCAPSWLSGERSTVGRSSHVCAADLLRELPTPLSSAVFRTAALDTIRSWGGGTWPRNADHLWTSQLAMAGGFVFDPTERVRARIHGGNDVHNLVRYRRRASVEGHYVRRELARHAMRLGLFTAEQLVGAVTKWRTDEASLLVVALSHRGGDRDLRRAAGEIFASRDDLSAPTASKHTRIAKAIGRWYLRFAYDMEYWLAGRPFRRAS